MKTIEIWKSHLRTRLKAAMTARQPFVVTVLREVLAALDNAEAPAMPDAPAYSDSPIAGSASGLGAGDQARLELSPKAVDALIQREIRERREAAAEYTRLGQSEQADVLTLQADVLAEIVVEVQAC